jgi:hypothetical protein
MLPRLQATGLPIFSKNPYPFEITWKISSGKDRWLLEN